MNPEWKDLSEGWYNQYCPEKCQDKRIDPSPSASPRESSQDDITKKKAPATRSHRPTPPMSSPHDVILSADSVLHRKTESSEGSMHSRPHVDRDQPLVTRRSPPSIWTKSHASLPFQAYRNCVILFRAHSRDSEFQRPRVSPITDTIPARSSWDAIPARCHPERRFRFAPQNGIKRRIYAFPPR